MKKIIINTLILGTLFVPNAFSMANVNSNNVSFKSYSSNPLPPTIVSESATPSMNSATLIGSVNPNGTNTQAWYETPTSGPFQTQSIGNGNSTILLMPYNLTGLNPDTFYKFRVVAINSGGTTYGSWITFKTLSNNTIKILPTPAVVLPSIVTAGTTPSMTTAVLDGSVDPNGFTTQAWFETTAGTQLGLQNIGNGSNLVNLNTYTLTGLSPNTNYSFRVGASNTNGTNYSNWKTFTTLKTIVVNASPTLTSISPTVGTQGQNNIIMTLTGSGFIAGSTVNFSGTGITINSTTINSTTSITVDISISPTAPTSGTSVTVTNTNGTSNAQTFKILNAPACAIPTITSISPSSVKAGSGITTVNISGTNFNNNSSVLFNGNTRTTNYVSTGKIDVVLTSSDTSSTGTGNITVSNGTCVSNAITFSITSSGGGGGGSSGGGGSGYITKSPNVTTQNATNLSKNSAVLNGSINPNGRSTTVWFEYGTMSNLLSFNQTNHISFGSGNSYAIHSQVISNLNPNTVYYFRAVANNSSGTSRGNIFSFTTQKTNNIIISNIDGDIEPIYKENNDSYEVVNNTTEENLPIDNSDYFDSKNLGASAVWSFANILPKTFIGWLIFLILILILIIIIRELYEDHKSRKTRNVVNANHIENLPV